MGAHSVCLPQVKKWFAALSTPLVTRRSARHWSLSCRLTQMSVPVAAGMGFQPRSRPEGSVSPQVSSKAECPLHQKSMSSKENCRRKLNTSIKSLLCSRPSPLCFCRLIRSNVENSKQGLKREKNPRIAEFESWKGAKSQVGKESVPYCAEMQTLSGEGQTGSLSGGPAKGQRSPRKFLHQIWYPGPWCPQHTVRIYF